MFWEKNNKETIWISECRFDRRLETNT